MRRLGGVMWHTRTYFHSLINVCDRFLERTKLSRSGAWPGRELFIARIGWGAHGGANDLVPVLPVSLCEPDKAIRVALGERHVEKCAMRKTLSGGFWTVSFTSAAACCLPPSTGTLPPAPASVLLELQTSLRLTLCLRSASLLLLLS